MARKNAGASLSPKVISLAVASCFAAGSALANPTGPSVVNGQVTINQSGNLLSVTNSPNSIINWQAFSINAGEITRFTQQSAASAVLNRVTGAGGAIDPSVILGALQSNGRVFLINPAGIVFGQGSQIDVAGLVASSLNLSNSDFLGGKLRFTEVPGAGSVVNQGSISTGSGGQVYLVGPSVTNSGLITSPKGEVILAAGNSVELVNPGTPNLRVEITAPDNEARNLGSIVADAGRVGIYAGLITHSGTIRADGAVATDDGRIVLKATRNTTIDAGSILSASGPSGGQITVQSGDTTLVGGAISATGSADKGGTVQVLGNLVGLIDSASIDVSGEKGGGTALVGGGFQGKNPAVQNAFRTYFGPNATIRADALGRGDGGTVIVWSDDSTRAYGPISARGGSQSGDGGFVEVSGHRLLDFRARVDTSAPNGRTGTLLLDPTDVCITSFGNPCPAGSGGIGSFVSGGLASIFTSSGGVQSILPWSGGLGSIYDNLQLNNVVITTSGDGGAVGNITIVDDSPNLGSPNLLQLVAHNDVNVNGRIWNTGTGELRIYAGWDEGATPVATLGSNPFGPVATPNAGSINVNAGVDMGGNVLMQAGKDIVVQQPINAGTQNPGDSSLILKAGNSLQVINTSLEVNSRNGGTATLTLVAGGGGISFSGAEGFAFGGFAACCGDMPGGAAVVNVSTTGTFSMTNGSLLEASGGEGGFGNGGNPGGPGGNAVFNLTAGPVTMTNSAIFVFAGRGGTGGFGSSETGNAGPGGRGGDAFFTANVGPVSLTGSSLEVNGGPGGSGGFGESGVRGGDGGPAGKATFMMSSPGNVAVTGGSFVSVFGGSGGRGGGASSGGRAGDGGTGGNTDFALTTGSLTVTGSTIQVGGGPGGSGGFASSGGVAGNGGNGGGVTATLSSGIVGGSISLNGNSSIFVSGGRGGFGGFASSGSSGAGIGGNGGNGGSAAGSLIATNISLAGSHFVVQGGAPGDPGFGSSGPGVLGQGGNASAELSAGGNINLQGASVSAVNGVGAEGGSSNGGNAVVAVTANGDITIASGSAIFALANSGIPAAATGGNASVLVSTLSNLTVTDSVINSVGGIGTAQGGSADTTIGAIFGNILIQNSTVEALGGSAIATGGTGGNAGLSAGSLGEVAIVNSFVGSFGGSGPAKGGNASTGVAANTLRVESTTVGGTSSSSSSSGPSGLTLFAAGGGTDGGTPGRAEVVLAILGEDGNVTLLNDSIQAIGGGIFTPTSSTPSGFGPGRITLDFFDRTEGGFSVNGEDGALSVGTFTLPPNSGGFVHGSGFFVNGREAVLNDNFFLNYFGIVQPPPAFDSQLISSLTALANILNPLNEDAAGDKGVTKDDKKKKMAECK